MSIQLYKAGTDHIINGIECELVNCEIRSLQGMLDTGWYTTPGDWIEKPEELEELEEPDEPEEIKELDLNSIRGKAKLAGIEGWDKKRIKTLEAELDEQKG